MSMTMSFLSSFIFSLASYLPAGELFDQIQRRGKLTAQSASFYAAEILQILIYLRQEKVAHLIFKLS